MTITFAQLGELADLLNSRREEWERRLAPLCLGEVRDIYDAVEGWQAEHNPTRDAVNDAYWRGHADGAMYARGQMAHRAEQDRVEAKGEPEPADKYIQAGTKLVNSAPSEANAAFYRELSDRQRERESEPEAVKPDSVDAATGIADNDWCDLGNDDEPEYIPTDAETGAAHERMLREREQDELAWNQTAAAIVAPLVPRRPRTLADTNDLAVELSAIIEALQAMAVDGEMPPILTYDGDRPVTLPKWERIQKRHGVASWASMARLAGLEYGAYRERITGRAQGTPASTRNKPGPKPGSSKMPPLDEICAELVRLAVGTGIMPSMNTFDSARPAAWPLAWGLVRNLGTSWNELAEVAGLKPRPHGRPVKESETAKNA